MGDYASGDDDYYESGYDEDIYIDNDRNFLEDLQCSETDIQWQRDRGPSCKVITKESLLAAQREDMQRVMDLLSLREHHARTLLIHYRWDVEKVFSVFVEKGKDCLYSESGVTEEELNDHYLSDSSSEVTCTVCFEDFTTNETITMDCGHCFCNNCWTEHFVIKITEGQSRRIRCMAHKCFAICDEVKVRNLVSKRHADLADKFDRFLLESYIEDNERVKWCPSVPHCGNAVRIEDDKYCEVECKCGLQFCFSCSSEAHSPCSCLIWKLWSKKCRDGSETVNWITVNAKTCPKCHKPVEKNGGCNLIRCVCGQPFCWLCGGATALDHTLDSIAGHTCGRFKEDHVKGKERAKTELMRYIHYDSRYKAHTDSLKAEVSLKEKLQENILTLEMRDFASKDFSWVTNGLYRLSRSRRILSYSYPFAYYMFGDDLFENEMTKKEREIKQNLFEDQQQQLEANVERLSMFLDEPFHNYSEVEVLETRMKIITFSTITDNLCKKLYECIENDLLITLQSDIHIIAPYRSKGVEKASELLQKGTAASCIGS